jgi:hypothetical protein
VEQEFFFLSSKEGMPHKYRPGQLVRLVRVGLSTRDASANDLYEVTRLMPADQAGDVAYRISSSLAGERAVGESEITAHVSPR